MNRFLTLLAIALTCLSLFTTTAEAKRFGGGGSFGKQRTMAPQQTQPAPVTTPVTAPAPAGNRWLGPLVRKPQPMQYAAAGAPYNEPRQTAPYTITGSAGAATPFLHSAIPADFPAETFLRSAKTTFIRLQAANDRKDLNDIREYTSPEMFAEVSMQIQERDNTLQKTDVIVINAELLEVANEGDFAIASVRFTGQLSENNGMPENVDEIWHVQKNLRDEKSVWLLAGIQQTVLH